MLKRLPASIKPVKTVSFLPKSGLQRFHVPGFPAFSQLNKTEEYNQTNTKKA